MHLIKQGSTVRNIFCDALFKVLLELDLYLSFFFIFTTLFLINFHGLAGEILPDLGDLLIVDLQFGKVIFNLLDRDSVLFVKLVESHSLHGLNQLLNFLELLLV